MAHNFPLPPPSPLPHPPFPPFRLWYTPAFRQYVIISHVIYRRQYMSYIAQLPPLASIRWDVRKLGGFKEVSLPRIVLILYFTVSPSPFPVHLGNKQWKERVCDCYVAPKVWRCASKVSKTNKAICCVQNHSDPQLYTHNCLLCFPNTMTSTWKIPLRQVTWRTARTIGGQVDTRQISRAVNDSCSLKYLFWGQFPPEKHNVA